MTYFGKYLMKHVKNMHTENYRMLLRKTEEPTYKEIWCAHGWNSQYC